MYVTSPMLNCPRCPRDFAGQFFVSRRSVLQVRKRMMKPFVTRRRFVFSRKFVVGPVVLAILGLAVGGKFLAQQLQQSYQFADSANCFSHATNNCNTVASGRAATHSHHLDLTLTVVTGQETHRRFPPKRVARVVAHYPAANSGLRIYPTQVPTSPPTQTTPTQVPTSPPTGQSSVVTMIEQVFGSYAPGALQVAKCESGYNPNAYNPVSIGGSHAAGVFQILYPSTWMGTSEAASSPYNASANIQAAHEIFVRDGYNWHEWSCAS